MRKLRYANDCTQLVTSVDLPNRRFNSYELVELVKDTFTKFLNEVCSSILTCRKWSAFMSSLLYGQLAT
ncbi:Secretory-abundant heat soluble protein [Trichinella pseudospiralis]